MVCSLRILTLIALLGIAAPARSENGSPGAQVPLAKAIEGLAPGPRIAYLEYLLKAGSRDPEVYFQLGVAFYDGERPDSALFYYAKAAALDTALSKAYVNMGVILDDQHREREASQMFEKAVSVNPRDVLAQAHAAYLLYENGEYDGAWEHLSKSLAIDSLNPQPHFYLAIFFWDGGMFREALVEFERVVSLAPGSYLAKKAEENITVLQEALLGPAEGSPTPPKR
ncbi:MAG TPA: tetratricopeptide repeat protein [Candidatus Bathyarchaeia archaeon]|nr:tetratricopeptide repeat protein [Candidatus Bathyarchaeia archaeon]